MVGQNQTVELQASGNSIPRWAESLGVGYFRAVAIAGVSFRGGENYAFSACAILSAMYEVRNGTYDSYTRAQSSTGGTLMKRIRMGTVCAALAGIATLAMAVSGQEKKESAEAHKIVHFGDLKWTPIIKGCDLAPVSGDPSAEGAPFVLRIRCADGIRVPPHWHPTDENVTVLKGTFLLGLGETFDETKLQTMNVGNYVLMPKEMRHFALCKGEMIVQVHGTGPFKNNWVNPSEVRPPDAPAAAAAKPKS